MSLFKKIVECLDQGGSVYESTTDFHVIAYLRSWGYSCIYLGIDKQVYLEIPAHDVESSDLCFSLFDKEGGEQ